MTNQKSRASHLPEHGPLDEKGREILFQMKETSSVPVFTKPAHALKSEDKTVCRQVSAQILAGNLEDTMVDTTAGFSGIVPASFCT